MVKTQSLHCQDLGSAHKPHGAAKKKEKTFMRGSREFPGMGELGGLPSMGSHRVRHD